jgi:hypothetical protein
MKHGFTAGCKILITGKMTGGTVVTKTKLLLSMHTRRRCRGSIEVKLPAF